MSHEAHDRASDEPAEHRGKRGGAKPDGVVRAAFWVLAALMLLTLLARVFAGTGWAVDMIATFAAQAALVSAVVGMVGLAMRVPLAGMTLLLIASVHWVWLAGGRADRASGSVDESRVVRVMTFNFLSSNQDPAALVSYLEEADLDLVMVLEARGELSRALAASPVLREKYPYRALRARWRRILLSRWPYEDPFPVDRSDREQRIALAARRSVVVRGACGRFVVTSIHPGSPRTPSGWAEGNREIRAEGRFIRERLGALGLPMIVCADLNATPSGHRTALMRRVAGLVRAKPLIRLGGTWPTWLPSWARVAIDDVMVSKDVGVRRWRTVEGEFGSDHAPVVVDVVLPACPADEEER